MRLLAVRGGYLASLEPFAIELAEAPLADSRIFAIVGPTGAGKSTLLDAICLALYDKVPRLLDARETALGADELSPNDPRAVMRRGAVEAFAEVDFLDRHGTRCRARWEVWRARKKPDGRLQTQRVSLFDLDLDKQLTEATKTETLRQIEDRLGLSFDEFRRAVLLPQGDFSAFLRAPADARANLLEKMTGTQIFGALSRAAHNRSRAVAQDLAHAEAEMNAVEVLSPEAAAALAGQRNAREAARTAHAARRAEAEAMLRWHEEAERAAADLRDAEALVATAKVAAETAETDRARLVKAEAAARLSEPFERWSRGRRAVTEAKHRHDRSAGNLTSAREAADLAQLALDRAEAALSAVKQREADDADDLAAARDLDGRLAEARQAVLTCAPKVQARSAEATEAQARLDEALTAHEAAADVLTTLQGWLATEAAWRPVAAQWSSLEPSLTRIEELGERQAEAARGRDRAERKKAALVDQLSRAANDQAAAETALEKAHLNLQDRQRALAEIRAKVPTKDRRDALEILAELRSGVERLKTLLPNAKRLDRRIREERKARRIAVKHAKDALRTLDETRQQRQVLRGNLAEVDAQVRRLEAVQAVAVRRQELLVEGQPCPLCGSTAHPAAGCEPSGDARLPPLRARRTRLQNELKATKEALEGARSGVRTHRAEAKEAQVRSEEATLDLEQLVETWRGGRDAIKLVWLRSSLLTQRDVHKLYLCIAEDPTAKDGRAGLQAAVDGLDAARADLAGWAEREDELRQTIDAAQLRRDELDAEHRRRVQAVHSLESQITAAAFERDQHHERWQAAERDLQDVLRTVTGLLAPIVEVDRITQAPATVRADIARGVELYEAKTAAAQAQRERTALVAEARQAASAEADRTAAGLREARDQHSEAVERRDRLTMERAGRLKGRSVAEYEADLARALEAAEAAVTSRRRELADATSTSAAAAGRHEDAVRALEAAVAEHDEAEAALDRVVAASDFSRESLASHLEHYGPDWQSATRARLQQVRDQLTSTEARADAARRRVEAHGAKGRPPLDRIESARVADDAQAAWEAEVGALGRIDERLQRDAVARQQRNDADAKVSALRDRLAGWSELDSVIGSADGKKLRSFAQGLTLESLVTEANLHLEQLRPRYVLHRVPHHDMDLMVIDRDLGDEPRSLSSLSGGETFLVSLALALALATLSSRNVRIESLFIDEGFGALDAEALEIALATLDQLQAEGRTIALISHIPDLAERIGYRVEVLPTAPGMSTVRVHGA